MSSPGTRFTLFPTPVFVLDVPTPAQIHGELVERLVAESSSTPGVKRSNVGGWHSVPDLVMRREECYQTVIRSIVEYVGRMAQGLAKEGGRVLPPLSFDVQAWAMVMRNSDYVTVHDHGDVHWSVAYYVDAGDDVGDHSGELAFVDPRRSGRSVPGLDVSQSAFHVKPRTGALVIFPGWLQHFVHAYRGQRPRVCISCNLTAGPQR